MIEPTGIETANPEQAEAWNGDEGENWAAQPDRFERVGDRNREHLLDHQQIASDARVLDVGCGNGRTTRDLGRVATDGAVVGIDLSAPMLEVARARTAAEGLANVSYVRADAQIHAFDPQEYDAVVSCFGAMFFSDPIAAFTNLRRAMRPGASLALLAWRELDENEWLTTIRGALAVGRELPAPPPDAPSPFSLADPARVQSRLTAAGFEAIELHPIDEPVIYGADTDDACEFLHTLGMFESLTRELDDTSRARAFEQLRSTVAAHERDGAVTFESAAWLITASATSD